jgi:hypothetical protein
VHLARVEVDEQRRVGRKAAQRQLDARDQECFEVVEAIGIRAALELLDRVALAPEAGARCFLGARAVQRPNPHSIALLRLAGIERRIDVQEPREAFGQCLEHASVVAQDDLVTLRHCVRGRDAIVARC